MSIQELQEKLIAKIKNINLRLEDLHRAINFSTSVMSYRWQK